MAGFLNLNQPNELYRSLRASLFFFNQERYFKTHLVDDALMVFVGIQMEATLSSEFWLLFFLLWYVQFASSYAYTEVWGSDEKRGDLCSFFCQVCWCLGFFLMVSCWFADHCLGNTHVKDILSVRFEVNPWSERGRVIQQRGSKTKVLFPDLQFAHGPKLSPSAISSYNTPEALLVLDCAQSPSSAEHCDIFLRLSSLGETLKHSLCLLKACWW